MKMHKYSYNPPKWHFNKMPRDHPIYYGVEVEVEYQENEEFWGKKEFINTLGRPWYWYAKRDGSLENGIEFVSHPHTLMAWRDPRHRKFINKVNEHVYVGPRCGIHIHVNRDVLSKQDIQNIRIFYKLYGRRLVWGKGTMVARDYAAWNVPWKDINQHIYRSRYEAVNCRNSATVEFRAFGLLNNNKCPVDEIDWDRVKIYLHFIDSLVHFSKLCSPQLFRGYIKNGINYIWDSYIDYIKRYYPGNYRLLKMVQNGGII